MFKRLRMPVRFKPFYRDLKNDEFTLLDVGCGYGSPTDTLRYFPRCRYHGIDRDPKTNRAEDLKRMEAFYQIDLDKDGCDAVPDEFFDVVLFSHVIEHLHDGLPALAALTRKVKPGGRIYIEYPGPHSLATPHAGGGDCLHFCDDCTHVRMYALYEVVNVVLQNQLVIMKAGTRRDPVRLLLTPAMFVFNCLRGRPWNRLLWDFFGFAEYVIARKPAGQRRLAEPTSDPAAAGALTYGSCS